jgi:hypothetical protein
MDSDRNVSFFFVLAIFAAGAVATILWQHAKGTSCILGCLSDKPAAEPAVAGSGLMPASLAGTATVPTSRDTFVEPVPVESGANWSVN